MKSIFEINGIQCEYDFLDADKLEKYENMLNDLNTKFEDAQKNPMESQSAQIRTLCGYIKEAIGNILPNVEELLPGNNYGECLDAIAIMSKAQMESRANLNLHLNSIHQTGNREYRRKNRKHKR